MALRNLERPARRERRDNINASVDLDSLLFAGNDALAGFRLVDPADIEVQPQVRRAPRTDEERENLQESIAETARAGGGIAGTGILQPLIVVPNPSPNGVPYVLKIGYGRHEAAIELKRGGHLERVPVYVETTGDNEQRRTVDQIIENTQRTDLNLRDLSSALYRMRNEWQWSWEDIRKRLGFNEKTLKRYVKIQEMHEDVQEMIGQRSDTLVIAEEVNKIPDRAEREPFEQRALAGEGVKSLMPDIKKVQAKNYAARAQAQTDYAPAPDSGITVNRSTAKKPVTPTEHRNTLLSRFKKLNSQVAADRKELMSIKKEVGSIIHYFSPFTDEQSDALASEVRRMQAALQAILRDIDRE